MAQHPAIIRPPDLGIRRGVAGAPAAPFEPPLRIIGSGVWSGPIYIQPGASSGTLALAADLAAVFGAMAAGMSVVEYTSGSPPGVYLGTYDEWGVSEPTEFVVRNGNGDDHVLIMGETVNATSHAAWMFARHLGYRVYGTTDEWSVVPSLFNVVLTDDLSGTRRFQFITGIGTGCGVTPSAAPRVARWHERNSISHAGGYPTGHSWHAIIVENQEEFNDHPEYGSNNVQGGGLGSKLCVLESAVEGFAISYAQDFVTGNPNARMVSLAASDGSAGWNYACTGTNEETLYNPADRTIFLANAVQDALDQDLETYRGVPVSIQAYGDTSVDPSPETEINPKLVCLVASGFISGGRTWTDVADGWIAAGAGSIIPYGYLSVWTWNRNRPGQSVASDLARLAGEVDRMWYFASQVTGYTCEGSTSWGPDGLGYWALGQMFNEDPPVNALDRLEELRASFINGAFPASKSQIGPFYERIMGDDGAPLLATDLVRDMYLRLQAALPMADGAERVRVYDLVIYTVYVDYLLRWETSRELEDFDKMMEWMFRTRDRDIVHFRCAYFDPVWAPWVDQLEALYGYPLSPTLVSDNHPWPDTLPDSDELDALIISGLAANPGLPFTPVGFDTSELVYGGLTPAVPRGAFAYMEQNTEWYLWMKDGQTDFECTVRGGVLTTPTGSGWLRIYDTQDDQLLHDVEIPDDDVVYEQSLTLPVTPGGKLFRVEILGENCGVQVAWTGDFAMSFVQGPSIKPFIADFSGWFYVPTGTTVIGGYKDSVSDDVLFYAGGVHVATAAGSGYFSFAVPPGEDGKPWRFTGANSVLWLMTVPPIYARSPQELLFPADMEL